MAARRLFALLLAVAACWPASQARATAQIPDSIEIDGQQRSLQTNPLDPYLARHPEAMPGHEAVVSSANWRGYLADWRIADERLWLTAVTIRVRAPKDGDPHATARRDILSRVFAEPAPIHATWYSGALIVPLGEMTHYVHLGYGSTYERYLIFVVKDGRVARRHDMTGEEFQRYKRASFLRYKTTDEYARQVAEMRGRRPAADDDFIDRFLLEYAAERYLSILYDDE